MTILKSTSDLSRADLRALYDGFDAPVTALDCGKKCAPHNPGGKPFCCDICHAVPAAYRSEWKYLEEATDLWRQWRGDECDALLAKDRARLLADTPKNMLLLACLGPGRCQRKFRALSCRQFPFFPYVTSGYRFIGLAYEPEFETTCWVVSNLAQVTDEYREQFICTYDRIFALFQSEFDAYAVHSEKLRELFAFKKRRFPILHRNGKTVLVSPGSERMRPVAPRDLPKFGFYR
jgi:hypothetical protein